MGVRPRLDILLAGGAGLDVRLNDKLGATLGLLYSYGLRAPYESRGASVRTLTLRGGLVYRIH